MDYQYQFTKINKEAMLVQIKYMKDGKPDFYKMFATILFTDDALHEIARLNAFAAIDYWDKYDSISGEITANTNQVHTATYTAAKTIINQEEPVYDPETQYLEDVISETEENIIYGFNIVNYNNDQLADRVRTKRNAILRRCDFYGLSDVSEDAAVLQYRQDLRDITSQAGFPTSVTWPTPPAGLELIVENL